MNVSVQIENLSITYGPVVAVDQLSATFPPGTTGLLERADITISVENNYTGQFTRLLRAFAGFDVTHSVHQYDGRPFCSETLAGKILRLARK